MSIFICDFFLIHYTIQVENIWSCYKIIQSFPFQICTPFKKEMKKRVKSIIENGRIMNKFWNVFFFFTSAYVLLCFQFYCKILLSLTIYNTHTIHYTDDWWSQALSVVNGAYASTKYNDKCCPPEKKKKIHTNKQTKRQQKNGKRKKNHSIEEKREREWVSESKSHPMNHSLKEKCSEISLHSLCVWHLSISYSYGLIFHF